MEVRECVGLWDDVRAGVVLGRMYKVIHLPASLWFPFKPFPRHTMTRASPRVFALLRIFVSVIIPQLTVITLNHLFSAPLGSRLLLACACASSIITTLGRTSHHSGYTGQIECLSNGRCTSSTLQWEAARKFRHTYGAVQRIHKWLRRCV